MEYHFLSLISNPELTLLSNLLFLLQSKDIGLAQLDLVISQKEGSDIS